METLALVYELSERFDRAGSRPYGRTVVVARASGKCVADLPWLLAWCKAHLIGVEQKAALISGSDSFVSSFRG